MKTYLLKIPRNYDDFQPHIIWGPGIGEDAIRWLKLNYEGETPDEDGQIWSDDHYIQQTQWH